MLNNQNPLNHIAAHALAFTAGALTVIAAQAYGLYMERKGRRQAHVTGAENIDRPQSASNLPKAAAGA